MKHNTDWRNDSMKVTERFLKYISFPTQSDPNSNTYPSTISQEHFAKILADECRELGLQNVHVDSNCIVHASLLSTLPNSKTPKLALIAHMDTSPDFNGSNINPQIVKGYDGSDITLCKDMVLSPKEFPVLLNCIGHDLITTDGKSLLGADDKAGIAEILTAMEEVKNLSEHGEIEVLFTPDEEIGRGLPEIDCDFAFTIDGSEIGELQYENFNAADAKITIHGKNVHPGSAKGIMVNSMSLAAELINSFPKNETPETTDDYQGFYFLYDMQGDVHETILKYKLRDFTAEGLDMRKQFVMNAAAKFNAKVDIHDEYFNMRNKTPEHVIQIARDAINAAGVKVLEIPIRGGTDGAKLSVPCPNIFTGGYNFHGPYEFISINSMNKAVDVIVNICKITIMSKITN